MTSPTVSLLLNSLFTIARAKYNDEHKAWIDLSFRLSGRFNLVPAIMSLQREGDLDLGSGLISSGPESDRREGDCGKEVSCEFVEARGDTPEMLELVEEPLDQIALSVDAPID